MADPSKTKGQGSAHPLPRSLILLLHGFVHRDRNGLGIPTEAAFVEVFRRHSRMEPPEDWNLWIAFHAFRFAAITQGVRKRQRDGNASSAAAEKAAAMMEVAASLGRSLLPT